MSVVSYHVRIDERMLEALEANADLFWEIPESPGSANGELLYLDKDWAVLSWLLSSKAREEQKHDVAGFALKTGEDREPDHVSLDAWRAAKAQAATKLGFQLVDTKSMPDDPALTAIQGRRPRDSRFKQIGYGARTFNPDEVADLSASLDLLTEADLREQFDPQLMESLDVEGIRWTEEDPDVFDKILLPCFDRLKEFYRLAAQARQLVLVVLT